MFSMNPEDMKKAFTPEGFVTAMEKAQSEYFGAVEKGLETQRKAAVEAMDAFKKVFPTK